MIYQFLQIAFFVVRFVDFYLTFGLLKLMLFFLMMFDLLNLMLFFLMMCVLKWEYFLSHWVDLYQLAHI
jgi:hypothetical protein